MTQLRKMVLNHLLRSKANTQVLIFQEDQCFYFFLFLCFPFHLLVFVCVCVFLPDQFHFMFFFIWVLLLRVLFLPDQFFSSSEAGYMIEVFINSF